MILSNSRQMICLIIYRSVNDQKYECGVCGQYVKECCHDDKNNKKDNVLYLKDSKLINYTLWRILDGMIRIRGLTFHLIQIVLSFECNFPFGESRDSILKFSHT